MSRILGILGGIALAGAVVWTVAAQSSPQSLPAKISQVIPVVASVPVTLDDGTVQTVTVPLTVTLDVAVSVEGAVSVGAEAASAAAPAKPISDTVTVDNAAVFLPELADMPDGWRLVEEGKTGTNEDVTANWADPKVAKAALDKAGRLGGYYRTFQNGTLSPLGNARISATVLAFETPEGAAAALDLYHQRSQERVKSGEIASLSPAKIPALGDKSDAYVLSSPPAKDNSEIPFDEATVAFQKGKALVFVTARSFQNGGDVNQLVKLAQMIEQRLP